MRPSVSIITPTFNHGRYISQCIDSVLAQTFQEWEQLVIDDGSTDDTVAVVSSYRDPRIRLIRQRHQGIENLKATYNRALGQARGEFVAVLEGDDYWLPGKLEAQLPLFKDNVALVWGPVAWVHEDGRPIATAPDCMERYEGMDRHGYLKELLTGNFIPALSVVMRKDALAAMGGFVQTDYMVTVDYPTWMECFLNWEGAAVSEVVGCWRRHPVQMSTARQHEILEGTLQYACEFLERLPEETSRLVGLARGEVERLWRRSIAESCFYEGRKCLLKGHWAMARYEFSAAMKNGGGSIRAKSLLGMLASYCRMDMEAMAALTGRQRIGADEIWI